MHKYAVDTMEEKFRLFLREKAVTLHLFFDSTPMRLSSSGYGNTKTVEVYVRLLVARAADGEEMKYFPELSAPECSSTFGVMSTIPLSGIFMGDFTHRPGFRVLLITTDGIPTNKASIRLLTAELQKLSSIISCSCHMLITYPL